MKKRVNRGKVQQAKQGMTLIESLVAISILLVVSAAVMSSAQGGLSATYAASDRITAYYLAQEANEYVRNVRDTNTLTDGGNWDDNLAVCINEKCGVDAALESDSGGLGVCGSANQDCNLLYDESTSRYGYGSGDPSIYTRYVELERLEPNEMRVTTTVEWKMGLRDRSIEVESLIFNWN